MWRPEFHLTTDYQNAAILGKLLYFLNLFLDVEVKHSNLEIISCYSVCIHCLTQHSTKQI